MFPMFVHLYLEIIYKDRQNLARTFLKKFGPTQEDYYQEDINRLKTINSKEDMLKNEVIKDFRTSDFVVKMSRDSNQKLKDFLMENKLTLLSNIINQSLYIEVVSGYPRQKSQIAQTAGALTGEVRNNANKAKVLFGIPKELDISTMLDIENDSEEDDDKRPKKKKLKKDSGSAAKRKKVSNNPNAPPADRVPFPEMKESDITSREGAVKEMLDRTHLKSPSICFFTVFRASKGLTCATLSEDSTRLCLAYEDCSVQIRSISRKKLRPVKSAADLASVNKEAEDVMERIMDDKAATDTRKFIGHSGPVYAVSINPEGTFLLSASEDGTIRLWSLHTFTCIVCFKGHSYPVWDVKFSPRGYYFVSGSHDRTARLWTTDSIQPLRVFVGHLSDVDCVQFHPNCNYIATGSSDRSCRLWDIPTGKCVRLFTGHKATVNCLTFSIDGRYMISGGFDKFIFIWDLRSGTVVNHLNGHFGAIYSVVLNRDGNILASGGEDYSIRLWNLKKIISKHEEMVNIEINEDKPKSEPENYLIDSYMTKQTPVCAVHFTRQNLLIGVGAFKSDD
ncbi:uncharacterized protein TRIADDRAFT_37330 [Trichoplax adhaerens]|uniref:Transcription initiation factor TFIID subunit 5 n=1 Tax=Trichoplax adhaerens TaxID=10228 RepID=B3RRF1_TRIAD|nr:hypothetical protein TRIADDRAFT_37330 [Trichoplax adhaerens]EDV26865.1 hypothetical protein TRIADDRAFT_37330 [Trichoplax adhaerens]|eukprot:XP_002110861.1 hypothetical protein TRIADDRAFT_37330 [Trichoplax adhaerens]